MVNATGGENNKARLAKISQKRPVSKPSPG